MKNANCFDLQTWTQALADANGLASGSCGLTDGSQAGDWRLPDSKELSGIIDFKNSNPALPTGHPFTGVQSYRYWSAATFAADTTFAWFVDLNGGF
ncbi:MAG: DUF1566 domain-containing protein, partial [Deltaproteobacteria bacterium]|nr:DUF1566 domain-containing protein [Deltaproteobacteria bacterium]